MERTLKKLFEQADRRRWARNAADSKYDAHRDTCERCKGKHFNVVIVGDCEEGANLARAVANAHEAIRNVGL